MAWRPEGNQIAFDFCVVTGAPRDQHADKEAQTQKGLTLMGQPLF
jgi:hypothetical protein